MKGTRIAEQVCPKCGKTYRTPPAISREDNETLICPDCGTREALAAFGCGPEEQEEILRIIHAHSQETTTSQ